MARNSDREWEKFGEKDPYYGVLSDDRYHRDKLNENTMEEFFESGRAHIQWTLDTIRKHLDPDYTLGSALDFGCGVGRLLLPLAEHFKRTVGIDVSDSMLAEARKVCAERGHAEIELVRSDDELSQLKGSFDLIHATLVFQHIDSRRGLPLVEKLLGHLNDGGVLSIQFPYHREVPQAVRLMGWLRKHVPLFHNLANIAYGKPFGEPLMEKNVYDINTLFALFQQKAGGSVHTEFQGRGKLLSTVIFFQKQANWIAYEPFFEEEVS